MGRLSDLRRFGAAPAGVRVATQKELRVLARDFDPWVRGLVRDELNYLPRRQEVGNHIAVLIAEAERREDRSPTLRELADSLPDDYVELLSEPDEEWDGDAEGWLREVCLASVIQLAIHKVITLSLEDGTARIGPGYTAILASVA